MKRAKRLLSILLAAAFGISMLQFGTLISHADTSFDEGDFRFTLTSENTVMVSGYYGSDTSITLPEFGGDKLVTGIYAASFENDAEITSVIIPRAYTIIGAFAFNGCTALSSVELPSGLKTIGTMAFNGCTSLHSVDLSYTAIETIGYSAFSESGLTSLYLPDSVTSISDNAFCDCTALSELRLPNGLTAIPDGAFYDCALTSLTLPDSVQTVGAYAFAENTSLASVDLPYSVTALGECCFYNDPLLADVFVPESVTSIGDSVFAPMSENGDINITCYSGSYAAEHFTGAAASELLIVSKLMGDVNLDGVVNINDATAIQKHLAMVEPLGSYRALNLADVFSDGIVSINDATKIQRVVAGFEAL